MLCELLPVLCISLLLFFKHRFIYALRDWQLYFMAVLLLNAQSRSQSKGAVGGQVTVFTLLSTRSQRLHMTSRQLPQSTPCRQSPLFHSSTSLYSHGSIWLIPKCFSISTNRNLKCSDLEFALNRQYMQIFPPVAAVWLPGDRGGHRWVVWFMAKWFLLKTKWQRLHTCATGERGRAPRV